MLSTTLAQLPSHIGAELGSADWILVDQPRIDAFADATEDHQWIHIDPERSARSQFGATIAHGYLTLSLVSRFLLDLLVVTDAGTAINYGLDRVRFPAPVPAGTRIRGHGELLGVTAITGGLQARARVTVEIEGQAKPGAVAEVLTRFLP
jgi:acyl dehydratase